MTTIILGLGALTIVAGYMVKTKDKEIERLKKREVYIEDFHMNKALKIVEKHKEEKENWKQTSSAWILEKEEMIERLERENFDQLHELALMLNDSYNVDKVILKKAELHDYLLHNANRRQRREFIEKGQFEL